MTAQPNRDRQAERDQERLVEEYLVEHPGSTVVSIREGIQAEHGIHVERVQRAISDIGKRRDVRSERVDHGRCAYTLGEPRTKVKLLGVEATLHLVDGAPVPLVKLHGVDVDDPAIAALAERLRASLARVLAEKVVPEAERVARAQRGPGAEQEGGDWLDTLASLGGAR